MPEGIINGNDLTEKEFPLPPFWSALTGSPVRAKVLAYLYSEVPAGESVGVAEVIRGTGAPAGSVHRALQQLVQGQLLIRESKRDGRPAYRAPHEDPRLRFLFTGLQQDSEVVARLKRVLRRQSGLTYAGIFGSFASGATHRGSDVDVLLLTKEGASRMEMLGALEPVATATGLKLDGQIYRQIEFEELLRAGEPVALAILSGPRIDLKGEFSWQH